MAGGAKRRDASTTQTNGVGPKAEGKSRTPEQQRKDAEKKERNSLVLWKRPLTTVEYFIREIYELISIYGKK